MGPATAHICGGVGSGGGSEISLRSKMIRGFVLALSVKLVGGHPLCFINDGCVRCSCW